MTFNNGPIEGVVIKDLQKFVDDRGYLVETFRIDELPEGIRPEMSYVSSTEPGVARGPHEHEAQTDVFAFVGPGNFRLVLWDNRVDSPTVGHRMAFYCGEDRPVMVIVPPGVVHGYLNVSRTQRGWVLNFPSKLYRGWNKGEAVDEVRHEEKHDDFYKDFTR